MRTTKTSKKKPPAPKAGMWAIRTTSANGTGWTIGEGRKAQLPKGTLYGGGNDRAPMASEMYADVRQAEIDAELLAVRMADGVIDLPYLLPFLTTYEVVRVA